MDENHKFLGIFDRFLKIYKKLYLENFEKSIILAYFSKNLTNRALIFRAFGQTRKLLRNFEKILNEISIEKMNFYLFLGKHVAKNRAFGNNIIFLQQFFPVRGGGFYPPPAYVTGHAIFSQTTELLHKNDLISERTVLCKNVYKIDNNSINLLNFLQNFLKFSKPLMFLP